MAVQSKIVAPLTNVDASGSAFAGPVVSGPRSNTNVAGQPANQGLAILMQEVVLNFNGTNAVSDTIYVPKHSVLIDIIVDTITAWNSATSDTLSVGTAAAGTQYASGVDVKAGAARQRPTFTTTQLGNMQDASNAVVATITPVGSASAGQTVVTLVYAQTINWQSP
jgi:hypothetical protein